MKITDILNESKAQHTDAAQQAIPNGQVWPEMDQFYELYRFSIAMAGAPNYTAPAEGATGQWPTTVAYSKAEQEIINFAAKATGQKGVSMASGPSKESTGTTTMSPFSKVKNPKYY